MTIANYLYALIDSDEYDNTKWQNWAEKLLENAEYDPHPFSFLLQTVR